MWRTRRKSSCSSLTEFEWSVLQKTDLGDQLWLLLTVALAEQIVELNETYTVFFFRGKCEVSFLYQNVNVIPVIMGEDSGDPTPIQRISEAGLCRDRYKMIRGEKGFFNFSPL